ncbi:bifunctional (p)ppGpp synthetase/guanosine-3',5'-bis(diphosphate) 3'-pyrophosphohydrolase [Schleiferiaceae bacterium]|jgi:GTP pyrophosphokinase|nr:bifunctional (p)ppGpp synthetase/guanosine-3',5'-bis(diphosphate) 3'-pyrophosphohydrolase [Schleiferiaceae bacterium]
MTDWGSKDKELIDGAFGDLLNSIEYKTDKDDVDLIKRAFRLANDAHNGIRRKTGEPYITHPIEVAQIVATEIGLGPTSIATALMHDVVEDSDYTLDDISSMFGANIAKLIDGLTKISGVTTVDQNMQLENYRKMLLTISDDIRVILIKIADRMHNMRTMHGMPSHKQLTKASETLFIYAPLAHRLGLYRIKTELEDQSLKYTDPELYGDIKGRMDSLQKADMSYLNKFVATVERELDSAGLHFEIKKRTKSIYSIRRKMKNQGVSFEEVYDKYAIRIILDSRLEQEKADCWKAYSLVTENFSPNPLRLRDWISSPKSNGYESLHTTVMGPDGHWVEVQIRTARMDDVAENGFAAHWKYKEDSSGSNSLDSWLVRIREFLEDPENDDEDFIESFQMNLFASEIFVFTPKGEMLTLPKGATALDFAFDIHSEVGAHCLGTKVNGKLVPMSTPLKSGDQIEILTSIKQEPKDDWLAFVKTGKAKQRIKRSLKREKQIISGQGYTILERKLRVLKLKATSSNIQKLVNYFGLKNPEELFYKVGLGVIDNKKLRQYARETSGLVNYFKSRIVKSPYARTKLDQKNKSKSESNLNVELVFGNDEQQLDYTLSKCCNPLPGERVFGFITTAEGIKIHRHDCPNAVMLQSRFANRVMKATWITTENAKVTVNIEITGADRVGLVNDVTKIISGDLNINIKAISFSVDDGLFTGQLTIEVADKVGLTDTINNIRALEGINSVNRVGKFN